MYHLSRRSPAIAGAVAPLLLGVLLTAGPAYADEPPPARDLTGDGRGGDSGGRDCANPVMFDPCANGWQ